MAGPKDTKVDLKMLVDSYNKRNPPRHGSSVRTPVLCRAGGGAIHPAYFGCPMCGTEVGGFIITGGGENDWSIHKDKFCKECGRKIDWSKVNWNDIYRY